MEGWVWPMPIWGTREPVISDGWHDGDPRVHHGVDLAYRRIAEGGNFEAPVLPYGTRHFYNPPGVIAIAAFDGRVSISSVIGTGGYVKIWHPGEWRSQYMHLSQRLVQKGDVVKAGQAVGIVGHNPKGYGWNHLHFELIDPSGEKVDPQPHMASWTKRVPLPGFGGLIAALTVVALVAVV